MVRCNLKQILQDRNLTIMDVFKKTGISRTTLTSLANNYAKGIQFDTLNVLRSALNVSFDELMGYTPIEVLISPTSLMVNVVNIEQYNTIQRSNEDKVDATGSFNVFTSLSPSYELQNYYLNYSARFSTFKGELSELLVIVDGVEKGYENAATAFTMLPLAFREDIEHKIWNIIASSVDAMGAHMPDGVGFAFRWDI